ncbi:MAG: hypothetical protein HOV77_32505, partial [Hamadaea sp.]|uniref:hypothetical protein n=1 Tax=Hamadaea sp. TaxID=2024425 RepID=UPI0018278566
MSARVASAVLLGLVLASSPMLTTPAYAASPTVTIDQGPAQADPVASGPITFAVTFSEAVTGFDAADISFTGSTAGGTLVAAISGT